MFGSNGRIDLIDERTGTPVRVQCKTACAIGGALRFWTSSSSGAEPLRDDGQIDEFAAFAPSTGLVYLVPVHEVPGRACFLRLDLTRNGHVAGVRWERDYLLGPP